MRAPPWVAVSTAVFNVTEYGCRLVKDAVRYLVRIIINIAMWIKIELLTYAVRKVEPINFFLVKFPFPSCTLFIALFVEGEVERNQIMV